MSMIDLSQLAAPSAVETLSFEEIVAAMKADFLSRWDAARVLDDTLPAYETIDLESDPVAILIQAAAYREVLIRARFNDGLKQGMIAFATDTNLDHVGAYFKVARLTGENDERFRRRIQLAPEAFSLAGPSGAYVYHALTAVPALADATAVRSADGEVTVTLLGPIDTPIATTTQIAAVRAALDQAALLPLTDTVNVQAASVIETAIVVELTLYPGPDGSVVKTLAEAALASLKTRNARLDMDLTISAIHSAAHQNGVQAARVVSPAGDIVTTPSSAVHITSITVTVAGRDT